MFESIELGRKIDKNTYEKELPELRTRLLQLQIELKNLKVPVIIIISGAEGAGKGETINRLNEWMDTRGIATQAFWDESDEEKERPLFWRFWRKHPPRGAIGIFFGSWYTNLIIDRVFKKNTHRQLEILCSRIEEHEKMLTFDGNLIIKFWFHLSGKDQKEALVKLQKDGRKLAKQEKKYVKLFKKFREVSETVIRLTDTKNSPWFLIESVDKHYRELETAKILIRLFEEKIKSLENKELSKPNSSANTIILQNEKTVLDNLDLSVSLDEKIYNAEMTEYKSRLNQLSWKAKKKKRSIILVFEGWDAAGKGSAIRRVTQALDARLYQVIQFAAPTDEEKSHHYLWRFWRQIPRAGYITIYDRSWYGRVLVERIENFASQDEWSRSYFEINNFEEQLHEKGIIVLKFWIHIDKEEQLKRFRERETIPWKKYKITDEDWRNRDKWDDYKFAVHEMVSRTSTIANPWTLIPGNDKKFARVEILKSICNRLHAEL